jgi:hypothetical protein
LKLHKERRTKRRGRNSVCSHKRNIRKVAWSSQPSFRDAPTSSTIRVIPATYRSYRNHQPKSRNAYKPSIMHRLVGSRSPGYHGDLHDPHAFSSLEKQSRQVRLLTLQPGNGEERLTGSLEVEFLDSSPAFEALSYTWGDQHDRRGILLNGFLFSITSSLDVALRYLR